MADGEYTGGCDREVLQTHSGIQLDSRVDWIICFYASGRSCHKQRYDEYRLFRAAAFSSSSCFAQVCSGCPASRRNHQRNPHSSALIVVVETRTFCNRWHRP